MGGAPGPARGAFLAKAADALEARVEQVARDMTAEMGKPLREARMEAARGAAILRFAAGEAWRPIGEVYAASVPNQRLYTVRRPVGVVGLITPWNFPLAIPVWKLAPALVHGNAVVLKLAYDAPRTGLHVAEAFAEAGLPAGVLNVLTGPGSKVGAALVESAEVRALSFTGSVAVGHRVRDAATARGCRVQLELGGQNPLVVAADAELDRAVEAAYAGAFWSAGQKCTATRRILVQETVYDAFREKLLARVAAGTVGDPADPETEVGPLVTETAFDEVMGAIEQARTEGGTVLAGGERADEQGYLVAPTVFEDVAEDALLSCEEVFGPVTALYRYATLDEALARANAVQFGLAALDLHPRPPRGAAVLGGAPGRDPPRQLADGGRRRPRPVRRAEGLRVRAARAGPGGARVLHRGRDRLPGRPAWLVRGGSSSRASWAASAPGPRARRSPTATRSSASISARTLRRLRLVLGDDADRVALVRGDITDFDAVERALDEHEITRVVHLAAHQVPFVRAEPAARDARQRRRHRQRARGRGPQARPHPGLAYASSTAVYSIADPSPAPEAGGTSPTTLYGVSKLADEGMARVYAAERGLASVGLRPYVVYGPGRDQGMTSGPTAAMLAAVRGEPYAIGFTGTAQYDYAPDVARALLLAADAPGERAAVYNAPGAVASVEDVVAAIHAVVPDAELSSDGEALPFPPELEATGSTAMSAPSRGRRSRTALPRRSRTSGHETARSRPPAGRLPAPSPRALG